MSQETENQKLVAHEAMDRSLFVADVMQILIDHPYFYKNADLRKKLEQAQQEVLDVYSEIMNRYHGWKK